MCVNIPWVVIFHFGKKKEKCKRQIIFNHISPTGFIKYNHSENLTFLNYKDSLIVSMIA